ncbi:MAG: glycosyltransferase [Longimicrobiales bacterium]
MICLLHGYLLEGSGSNLWTRLIVEALCRQGRTVHLMAQENHPDRYPFITELRTYRRDGTVDVESFVKGDYPGQCILHKPILGDTLPVYVWDRYEEFPRVVPMVDLTDHEIEDYTAWNARVLTRIVAEHGVTAVHANHSVLMPQVAERSMASTGVPFSIMPHGSGLEYAVKRDVRYLQLADASFREARRIFVHGEEMRSRVRTVLTYAPELEPKFVDLHLGVDTSQFNPATKSERPARIAQLQRALSGLARGRTAEQTQRMTDALRPALTNAELVAAMDSAQAYDNKAPDADVEAKLAAIDWEQDPTMLYVGRLISTKGIQSVIAALPLLLRANPTLKLIVVGHGPLREPLEAMLWAMQNRDLELLRHIADHGRTLERAPQGDSGGTALTQVTHFLDSLKARGELEDYLDACDRYVRSDTVVFTGYLTHRELHFLFPCCDAAIFPSVVKEAGPLVFLEALAAGAFPMGTYFAGMQASIDALSEVLPADVLDIMKLSADPHDTVRDIARNAPAALEMGERYKETLFNFARSHYDWTSVADMYHREIESM